LGIVHDRRFTEPMTDKQLVLDTVHKLPDDTPLEKISEEIEFLVAVQQGLQALDTIDEPVNPSLQGINAYFQTNWRRAADPRFDSCKNTKTFTITRKTNIALTSSSLQNHTLEEATSSLRAEKL